MWTEQRVVFRRDVGSRVAVNRSRPELSARSSERISTYARPIATGNAGPFFMVLGN